MSAETLNVAKMRVGHGFDVHPYTDETDRSLVLGGVVFPEERGLTGHSDADVIAHACTDALLGPYGSDIGALFPDTDPALAGADSLALLRLAVERLTTDGWVPISVDCTVVLDRPKLAPHRATMETNLSTAVGAPVTIKGKRTEGLAALAGGVRCYAVGLLCAP